jgi:hypothetical protein
MICLEHTGQNLKALQGSPKPYVIQLISEGSGILKRNARKRGCPREVHGSLRIGVESTQAGAALAFYETEVVEAGHAAIDDEGAVLDAE